MKQINFRIDDDYFTIIKTLADESNTSIADLAKRTGFGEVSRKKIGYSIVII